MRGTSPTVRWPGDERIATEAASPFAEAALVPGEPVALAPGVAVTPWPPTALLVLRGDAGRVGAAIERTLGVAPPGALESVPIEAARIGAKDEERDARLRWTGPEEWLLSSPIAGAAALERRLREAGEEAPRVVEVSCAFVGFELEGERVDEVLARSTVYDVHPRAFPPGKVVGTVFAKTAVTLGRLSPTRVELIARRSFADYLARWLARAAAGLDGPVAGHAADAAR